MGHPTVDMEIRVAGDGGAEVATGGIGEVEVCSRYLAVGYWGDPARTAERFRVGPDGVRHYRSGDLGRRRRDGAIELLGRKDLLVKLDGAWVDLAEVEHAVLGLDGVKDAAVAVHETGMGRAELVAYVVPAAAPLAPADLRAELRLHAPGLRAPTRWRWLDALPIDANGKIDRARLPAESEPERQSPRGAADGVAACWREILGRQPRGRTSLSRQRAAICSPRSSWRCCSSSG